MSFSPRETHPCFSQGCNGYARIHLPVAPECNLQCNYCLRRFSCVNESRPGVTTEIMTPVMALERFRKALKQLPKLTVAGIAGPGDALANWSKVRETLEMIRRESKEIKLCLSTNGLLLPEYAQELLELGVGYLTVTVNAVTVKTAARIYSYADWKGRRYADMEAAGLLLERQKEGLAYLKGRNIKIKLNTVVIPGVNVSEIEAVAALGAQYGVCRQNLLPLLPLAGTPFEGTKEPSVAEINRLRLVAGKYLGQMLHCRRCRADAAGLV